MRCPVFAPAVIRCILFQHVLQFEWHDIQQSHSFFFAVTVLSFPYPLRFLFANKPEVMTHVLAIVYRVIATHLIKKAGFTRKSAHTGAVTLIQRFGSALNLNLHFHMLFLDGVYVERGDGRIRFRWVKAPLSVELTHLADTIARRVGRYLERQGLLEREQ